MSPRPAVRIVVRGIVAVGILLTMLLAGGAPSDFAYGKPSGQIQVAP